MKVLKENKDSKFTFKVERFDSNVEPLDEEVLEEARLYRLDLYGTSSSGKGISDRRYIIGNNNSKFTSIPDIIDFLKGQEKNNERVSSGYVADLNQFSKVVSTPMDFRSSADKLEYIKAMSR